jgi:hypothetical protein
MPSGAEAVHQSGVVGTYSLVHRRYQHNPDLFTVGFSLSANDWV